MGVQDFKGMTLEQFVGNPQIVDDAPEPHPVPIVRIGREPFMEKYEAVYILLHIVVYEGDRAIGQHMRGVGGVNSVVWVDPAYRGQGIATEMIYQAAIRTNGVPTIARVHTAASYAAYAKAFARIQKEII